MSNINPYNIDGTFPVAGQDNSSQGFRNNFTNIKNNFTFAQQEITDLQSKVLLTSALTGQSLNNDMAGEIIRRPQLQSWTQTILNLGTAAGPVTLDFNVANFQEITTGASITLNFINWPSTSGATGIGYGLMRVWINVLSVAHTVTLPTTVTTGVSDLAGYSANIITFDAPGNYAFDFSSFDGGSTYIVSDVTRNHSTLRDPSLYFNNSVNSTLLVGFGNGLSTALQLEAGQDKVSTYGSYNSVAVGNINLANVAYTQFDTGAISGYSVTGARGSLNSISAVQPVYAGDLLGYVNALGFTGNGAGNVFQQVASIDFFATGSNVAYGLGGNIAFFTADDGGNGVNIQRQAVGIENDLSTKFYGNVEVSGVFKTDSTIIEGGTYANTMVTTGGVYNQFVANSAVSTVIIDSSASAAIPLANIILPSNPAHGQKFKISAVAPITTSNVYAPNFAAVKWVPANTFSTGNVVVSLTYLSGQSTWYRS